jgi:hypothetical protein
MEDQPEPILLRMTLPSALAIRLVSRPLRMFGRLHLHCGIEALPTSHGGGSDPQRHTGLLAYTCSRLSSSGALSICFHSVSESVSCAHLGRAASGHH